MPELVRDRAFLEAPVSMFGVEARIVDREAFNGALKKGLNLTPRSRAYEDVAHAVTLKLGDYAVLKARKVVPYSPAKARARLKRIERASAGLTAAIKAANARDQRLITAACGMDQTQKVSLEVLLGAVVSLKSGAARAAGLVPGKRASRKDVALDFVIVELLMVFRFHCRTAPGKRPRALKGPTAAQVRLEFVKDMLQSAGIPCPLPRSIERRVAYLTREIESGFQKAKA